LQKPAPSMQLQKYTACDSPSRLSRVVQHAYVVNTLILHLHGVLYTRVTMSQIGRGKIGDWIWSPCPQQILYVYAPGFYIALQCIDTQHSAEEAVHSARNSVLRGGGGGGGACLSQKSSAAYTPHILNRNLRTLR